MNNTTQMMPTGIPGFDHLLKGGIVRGNSLLVEGPPGSGKSTLGIRILYEGAIRYNEPGLIITFEEFPRQIYQEAMNFGIDLQKMEQSGMLRVVWTPPARILQSFRGKNDLIEKIVTEMGVRRLLIDSITHFKRVTPSEVELREILAAVLSNLKIAGVNPILIKELERQSTETIAFEEYLVDASVRLHNRSSEGAGENLRHLEIRKTRGQDHVSGHHPFRLTNKGLDVYPRLQPDDIHDRIPLSPAAKPERIRFGVKELDEMLMGGVWKDSLVLVSGYAGTGKSVLAYHFIDEGLRNGEPCIILGLRTGTDRLLSRTSSLGMDWRPAMESGQLRALYAHPVGLVVEEVFATLIDEILKEKPARFVIDTIDDLTQSVRSEDLFREYILVLATLLHEAGVTSVFLHDTSGMGGEIHEGPRSFTNFSSCSIKLSMAEADGEIRRFVGVEKHTASDHVKELRQISIDGSGFHIHAKAAGLSGILTGQTHGAMQNVAGEVIPALDRISSSLRDALSLRGIPDDALTHLRDARQHVGLIDVVLKEYFGETNLHQSIESMMTENQ